MEIVNCCPHDVVIKVGEKMIRIAPSGYAPRASSQRGEIMNINGIPVNTVCFGDVIGMPQPEKGKVFVVSRICAEALKGKRDDVFIVDGVVKDDTGAPMYCTALSKL